MKMKLLFIIANNEHKIERIINAFKLPFNTMTRGNGTASKSMLDFFGLAETEKYVSTSIFPDYMEKRIFDKLDSQMHLKAIGNGIAFSVPLSSSSKYVQEAFNMKKEGEVMEEKEKKTKYHLLLTIVQEGYADKVMNAAKKCGANGGTLINARGLGDKSSFKFFNITMEPEKDIILIVCDDAKKDKIMEAIIEKTGIKTEGKGMCISLPIDSAIGIN